MISSHYVTPKPPVWTTSVVSFENMSMQDIPHPHLSLNWAYASNILKGNHGFLRHPVRFQFSAWNTTSFYWGFLPMTMLQTLLSSLEKVHILCANRVGLFHQTPLLQSPCRRLNLQSRFQGRDPSRSNLGTNMLYQYATRNKCIATRSKGPYY